MSERILIVDDDPAERRLLDHMVHQLGYEPVVAASSDTVVAALADTYAARIDALVLDLTMSDFDAVGLLATMRAAGLPIPIIVQTRDDAIDKLAAAMRAGATDFVVKPVGAERLRVSLRNALFTRALEAELARVRMGASAPTSTESAENAVVASSGGSFAPPLVPSLAAVAPPSGVLGLLDGNGNMRALEDIEAEAIRFAITHYHGQMSEIARRLRIGRSTLYRKLDSFGLNGQISHPNAPAL
jgi:DNA-binding NtrC family response regulator